ncbi:MAG TPA: peptide deformylase [Polyangia bacterium]|nr:peptide deformylase [Polyangia bacterium]
MAIHPILRYPDPRLRQPTHNLESIEETTRTLVADMIETMYAANGAGLAAIQLGADVRVFVVDGHIAGGPEDAPAKVFINPELTYLSEDTDGGEEGCLSFPGVFVPIKRALRARCRALDLEGQPFEIEGEGLFARALQHEIDHLNGRLLIDMVGPVKREMIKRKMKRAAETGDYEEARE